MIASSSRTEDIRIRALMLDAMEICLRLSNKNPINSLSEVSRSYRDATPELREHLLNAAKTIGQASATLKEKITTKDYRSEDDLLRRISTLQTGG